MPGGFSTTHGRGLVLLELTAQRVRANHLSDKRQLRQRRCRHPPEKINMQTVLPSEFKRMMVLMLEGAPHVIEDFHLSGTARTKHKLHTRLRHLKTGRVIDRVFAENERVPVVQLETRRVSYSYTQGDIHVFLDAETFEELELSGEQFGERRWFLKENEEYKAMLLEGRLLDIVLPPQVPLKVVETAPPVRGGSDATWKEARLETGLEIMVPLFIGKGETVRVDTATKRYAGKETS
jgi:elongation factor P